MLDPRRKTVRTLGVGLVGLVVGLAAPAAAAQATHLINGATIQNHTITRTKLKLNTLTGAQINESTLGVVPEARTLPPLVWHPITAFQNGWSNYSSGTRPAAYAIDAQGIVHLRGVIHAGTAGETAFTLPATVLPPKTSTLTIYVLTTATNNAMAALALSWSGATPQNTPSASASAVSNYFNLEGISFASAGTG
jgi:hypothetical protein